MSSLIWGPLIFYHHHFWIRGFLGTHTQAQLKLYKHLQPGRHLPDTFTHMALLQAPSISVMESKNSFCPFIEGDTAVQKGSVMWWRSSRGVARHDKAMELHVGTWGSGMKAGVEATWGPSGQTSLGVSFWGVHACGQWGALEASLAVFLLCLNSFSKANSNSINTVTPCLINSDFSIFD